MAKVPVTTSAAPAPKPKAPPSGTTLATNRKASFEYEIVERYEAVGSPSLPNYLAATSGSTHGVSDDAPPSEHRIVADNVFRQVRHSGGTALSYQEAMPSNCLQRNTTRYAVKHNPAAYYASGEDREACRLDNLPLRASDPTSLAGSLATFTFVTPDLCNDSHDCSVATGDAWLQRTVSAIVNGPTYRAGTTVLFLVWDEPTPMPFIMVAPWVRPGTQVPGTFNHYSLLRATEDLLGLGGHLGEASSAADLLASLPA